MSAEQYFSGACPAWEGLDTDQDGVSHSYPVVHGDSSVDIIQPENTMHPTGLASSLLAAQPYWFSLDADLWVPSTQEIASAISMPPADTELAYESFDYPDRSSAGQSINLTLRNNPRVPQVPPRTHHPTPRVVDASPRPDYTSQAKPSTQRFPATSPRELSPCSLKCEWRGCTYTGTFSRSAQLKRHVNTQHIHPGSFVCQFPGCDKAFNRKDNLGVHMEKMHQRSDGHPQYQAGAIV